MVDLRRGQEQPDAEGALQGGFGGDGATNNLNVLLEADGLLDGGFEEAGARGSVRLSLGRGSSEDEVELAAEGFVEAWRNLASRCRGSMRASRWRISLMALGPALERLVHADELNTTSSGVKQAFLYAPFRRRSKERVAGKL